MCCGVFASFISHFPYVCVSLSLFSPALEGCGKLQLKLLDKREELTTEALRVLKARLARCKTMTDRLGKPEGRENRDRDRDRDRERDAHSLFDVAFFRAPKDVVATHPSLVTLQEERHAIEKQLEQAKLFFAEVCVCVCVCARSLSLTPYPLVSCSSLSVCLSTFSFSLPPDQQSSSRGGVD